MDSVAKLPEIPLYMHNYKQYSNWQILVAFFLSVIQTCVTDLVWPTTLKLWDGFASVFHRRLTAMCKVIFHDAIFSGVMGPILIVF